MTLSDLQRACLAGVLIGFAAGWFAAELRRRWPGRVRS